jgi:hypothetical protein
MKLFFALLMGVVSCMDLALEPVIPSNLEELNVDEPTLPDEVLVDLDEDHFKAIMYDEDALLAMMAHANPNQVKQGIALVRSMLADNAKGKKKLAQEKAKLNRIIRLFKLMQSAPKKNLLGSKWMKYRRPALRKLIASRVNVTKQWRLSFQVYQWKSTRNWGSIVHFTKGPNGSRLPAIWFQPNNNKLHMCMWTGKSTNDCWNSAPIAMKKWHKIVMMQRRNANGKFTLSYFIDGVKKATKAQTRPQAFRNLKVYSSDPWYMAPLAYVKNLRMVNL